MYCKIYIFQLIFNIYGHTAESFKARPYGNSASVIARLVKNLLAMPETPVLFLGAEDSLEKEMATHSSIPAWEIPWTEEPGRLQSMGLQKVRYD